MAWGLLSSKGLNRSDDLLSGTFSKCSWGFSKSWLRRAAASFETCPDDLAVGVWTNVNDQSPVQLPSGHVTHTLSRRQSLDGPGELVQRGVGSLEEAVDDINDPGPVALDIVDVFQTGTYSFRICCRRAQKTFRKTEKPRILSVQLRAQALIQRPVEREVFGGELADTPGGRHELGLDGGLKLREVIHDCVRDQRGRLVKARSHPSHQVIQFGQ